MAQQTTVTLTDDIDGGKAVETVSFGLDGRSYEIDLSKRNAAALRKALGEFTVRRPARPADRVAARARRAGTGDVRSTPRPIREWAAGQGISVSARGRVPADVRRAVPGGAGLTCSESGTNRTRAIVRGRDSSMTDR